MKVLLYCQHLSGSGHFVRTYEIARALAESCEVHVVDGGLPVPRRDAAVSLLSLPRIHRREGEVLPIESTQSIAAVMDDRARVLARAVDDIDPDVIVVEHFPFSKGSLRDEVVSIIERSDARVFCSLRDIAPTTRTDAVEPEETLRLLDRYFDTVFVHGDPTLTTVEEQIPWTARSPVPLVYTGIVSERPVRVEHTGDVVVSVGGGAVGRLAAVVRDAWRLIGDERRELVMFGGLRDGRASAPAERNVRVEPYGPRFLEALAGADLSISEAGYNTCANLLETRVPAIVVPRTTVSDQAERARLLASRGLVVVSSNDVGSLADAMRRSLGVRMPEHGLDLNGAIRTSELIMAAGGKRTCG